MVDKIIIDGVDVSECGYYKNKNCITNYLLTDVAFSDAKCAECPNCYYKQLKRKEEECKKLGKSFAKLTEMVEPYIGDFTGYNEETGGFDIILCVKELLEQLSHLQTEH